MYVPAHNVTDRPVAIDFEGRTLGGGEWGPVDRTDDAVEAAVEAGVLVLVEVDPKVKDLASDALDAHDAAQALEERRKALTGLEAGKVRALATEVGLIDPADDFDEVGVAQLRRALARRTDVELPADPEPKKAAGAAKATGGDQ